MNTTVTDENTIRLLVPYSLFGPGISEETWSQVTKHGIMATLPLLGVARFFWYSLCGWSLIESRSNGVLFAKLIESENDF